MKNGIAKKCLGLLAACGVALGMVSAAWADTATVDGVAWSYEVADGTATVTGASPCEGNLSIPAALGGYPVAGIQDSAFYSCNGLTGMAIPDCVTTLGSYAFSWCTNLVSVSLGDGIADIPPGAFYGCSRLESVEFGSGVATIGRDAFFGCGLTSITLPAATAWLDDGAFGDCANLVSVSMPGVTAIGRRAFLDCTSLQSIVIPAGVTNIGNYAFSGCASLASYAVEAGNAVYSSRDGVLFDAAGTELLAYPMGRTAAVYVIPAGVESIVTGAFADCQALSAIEVAEGNGAYASADGVLYSRDGTELVCWPKGKATGNVAIPPGTLRIADQAFEGRDDLFSVSFPAGLQRIGRNAFYQSGLTAVELPEGLKRIEDSAFNSTGLTTITIPKSTRMTGQYAFGGCPLTNAVILGGAVASSAFEACTSMETVTLGTRVSGINSYAFYWYGAPNTVYAPASWEGRVCPLSHAFRANIRYNCNFSIVYYDAPDDGEPVEEEEEYEDVWCYEVADGEATLVDDWGGLPSVGGKVIVPATLGGCPVTAVGAMAFSGHDEISSLRLPDGVRSIGDGAFQSLDLLVTLWIPESAESIGADALSGCTNLASLCVPTSWEGTDKLDNAWGMRGKPEGCTVYYGEPPTSQHVTFAANGGTCGTEEKTYAVGEAYGNLPTPKWSGHVWLGWWTDPEAGDRVTAESMVPPVAELTLWAHWTDKQVTTFDGNGGTPESQKTTNTIAAAYGTLPTAEWAGHAFLGWYTAAEGGTKISKNTAVKAMTERTFYAHWTDKQVTTFDGNGGSPKSQKTTNTIAVAFGTLPTAQRARQAFLGWYTAAEGGTRISTNTAVKAVAARTFYAHWTDQAVTTFKGNGGKPVTQKTTNTIGAAFGMLPEVAWADHVFLGWYTEAEGGAKITTNSTVKTQAARTFYAHWSDRQVVTFKGNGGSPETKKTTNTIGTAYGTLPTPSQSGHAFLGWFTKAGGGSEVKGTDLVTAATARTLYAHWTDKQVTTFDGNGGSPKSQKTTNTIATAFGTLPTAQRARHAFLGWYTAAEGGTKISRNTPVRAVATRTFYAHWTDQAVTTFDGNGGSPATQKTTNTIGTAFGTLPEAAWADHVFLGWYTAADGGSRIKTTSTVKAQAARTFYAHWKAAKDVFRISAMEADSAAQQPRSPREPTRTEYPFLVRFEATAGTEYEIQWTPVLATEWTPLGRWIADEDCEAEVPVSAPDGSSTGFFRVLAIDPRQ